MLNGPYPLCNSTFTDALYHKAAVLGLGCREHSMRYEVLGLHTSVQQSQEIYPIPNIPGTLYSYSLFVFLSTHALYCFHFCFCCCLFARLRFPYIFFVPDRRQVLPQVSVKVHRDFNPIYLAETLVSLLHAKSKWFLPTHTIVRLLTQTDW